jgi:probable addiction module antidote protein
MITGVETMATKKKTKPRSVSYDEVLQQSLKSDIKLAQAYLNAALVDEDSSAFLIAVKHVAAAYGLSMSQVAEVAGIQRGHIYDLLSENGNPKWSNLRAILKVLGGRLEVKLDGTAAPA